MQAITDDFHDINSYVGHLQHFHSIPHYHSHLLELQDFSFNTDFAAVMHASNSTTINPCFIIVCHWENQPSKFINILSHHYKPLHYVLLFPHTDIGWGLIPVPDVPQPQMDWYHSQLLANNDKQFSIFKCLCCEFLVDIYSHAEEEHLAYINQKCRHWAEEVC